MSTLSGVDVEPQARKQPPSTSLQTASVRPTEANQPKRDGIITKARNALLASPLFKSGTLKLVADYLGIGSAIGQGGLFTPRNFAPPTGGYAQPQPQAAVGPVNIEADRDRLTAQIGQALRAVPEKGEVALPNNLAAVAALLEPDLHLSDLKALDALQSAFHRDTRNSRSRVLLAIARSVTRPFGTDDRLPLTASQAWAMLDPILFTDEIAEQFDQIGKFILGWQADKKDFLLLDPSEFALIEYMFENLHPRRQGILVAKAMDFKALSLRRLGLLRRMSTRCDQMIRNAEAGGDMAGAIQYAKDCLALLDHIARPGSFLPIIEEAKVSAQRIVKAIQRVLPPPPQGALPPGGQPQAALPPGAQQAAPALPAPPQAAPQPQPPPQPVQAQPEAIIRPDDDVISDRPMPAPPQRLSKRHRTDAVVRYLRGEDIEKIAKSLGVKPTAVESWTEAFIAGGAHALTVRKRGSDKSEPEHDEQASVEEMRRQIEQLSKKVEQLSGAK